MKTPQKSCGRDFFRARLLITCALLAGLWGAPEAAKGQLFSNLVAFGNRLSAGDPTVGATNSLDGPKGLASADFNHDGLDDLAVANTDGTVTVFLGVGDGKFGPPRHLQTGVDELRGIIAADMNGDGAP